MWKQILPEFSAFWYDADKFILKTELVSVSELENSVKNAVAWFISFWWEQLEVSKITNK